MARTKKKPEEKKQWEKAKWIGFVPLKLKEQEKEAIKKNLLSEDACWQSLQDAATAGYKVSLSYSIPEDVYTVSLTGNYQDKPNPGLTVSMRHRDLATAVSALAFVVGEDGWSVDWEDRFGSVDKDDW